MAIKTIAHSAQLHLQAVTGSSIKRSHVYELLAAAFDYRSYAALSSAAVFAAGPQELERTLPLVPAIRSRFAGLGYPSGVAEVAASALTDFITEGRLVVVEIADLIDELQDESVDADEVLDRFDASSPLLLDGLKAAANRGSSLAHYALALLHVDHREQESGSSYWYSQEQEGRLLTGVQKEWADAYAWRLAAAGIYEHHLREAGRLGNEQALLDLAEFFDDPRFFEETRSTEIHDPVRAAAVAKGLGRREQARHWHSVAASWGNTDAMRQLIEEFDAADLPQCWTWVYLAQLLGDDLTKDRAFAINDDGSPYDDDVGGPAFVDDFPGIALAPLDAAQDALARRAARELFDRIPAE